MGTVIFRNNPCYKVILNGKEVGVEKREEVLSKLHLNYENFFKYLDFNSKGVMLVEHDKAILISAKELQIKCIEDYSAVDNFRVLSIVGGG